MMSENEVEARIEKKDVTADVIITDKEIERLLDDEELEREVSREAEEVGEEEFERPGRRLMSEDEFFERIDDFEERNHGLTLLLDRFFKLLAKYGKKYDVELDLELWSEVAKPSLNVGFWYYQLVEGQNLMVSYPKISLGIGALATLFIGLGALAQIKSAKKKAKDEVREKAQKGIEGKAEDKKAEERQNKTKEKVEELKANSKLLERVNKNLSS